MTSVIPETTIFGTKVSVTSWICVAACRIETARPTIRLAARNGSASSKPSSLALITRWIAMSPFTCDLSWAYLRRGSGARAQLGVEGVDDPLDGQGPAVHQHEQQDLERERDERRGQHHHPHGHERRRDDHVDDQERQEQQEADLERRLELRQDEGGDQDVGRHVGARLRALAVRELHEEREVGVARLLEHERPDRLE